MVASTAVHSVDLKVVSLADGLVAWKVVSMVARMDA